MKAFFIRLAELLLVNCILSAIVAAAFATGLVTSVPILMTFLVVCADAIFLVLQYSCLRALCSEAPDLRVYFAVSLSSFAVFAALNFILLELLDQVAYTWLFITAKLLSIATGYRIGNLASAIFFQFMVLAVIFLAPIHRTAYDKEKKLP